MNVIDGPHVLPYRNLPVELTHHILDTRGRVLVHLEVHPVTAHVLCAEALYDFTDRNGLHEVPVVVGSNQPAESDLRVVKKVFLPVVLRTLESHTAYYKPDYRELALRELAY